MLSQMKYMNYDGNKSTLLLKLTNVSQIIENSVFYIFATKNDGVYIYDKVTKKNRHINVKDYFINRVIFVIKSI